MQSPERPKRQDGVSSEKQWPVCKSAQRSVSLPPFCTADAWSTYHSGPWAGSVLARLIQASSAVEMGWAHRPGLLESGQAEVAAPRLRVAAHRLFVLNLPQLTRRLSLHCSACITKKAVRLYFSWERNRISGCVFAGTQIPHIQRAGTEPPPTQGIRFQSNLQWMWLLAKSRQLFYKQVHLCIFSQLPCDRVGKCTCK